MGNINSGRRREMFGPRPQVEDAALLDIAMLRKAGALTDGALGLIHIGQGSLIFSTQGDIVTLGDHPRLG